MATTPAHLYRSLAFVPGNNERFVAKAPSLEADIVCFDLEDSVPRAEKAAARRMVAGAVSGGRAGFAARSVFVRTNSPASGMIGEDLGGALVRGMDGIVVPKVDTAAQVVEVAAEAARIERERGLPESPLAPSIESAAGVVNCHAIASASPRVQAVVFGVFDLLNDMGIEHGTGAAAAAAAPGAGYARAKIAVDSAAAGAAAIDAIWQDVSDAEGLAADCLAARRLGYAGKSVIHPSQIAPVHEAFAPTAAEIGRARRTRDAYLAAAGRGRGATVLDGSAMIDEVHYKRALALLEAAGEGAPSLSPPPA